MLMPITNKTTAFCADNTKIDPKTGEYKDPLMRWPLRGAAFTNEVGEALRPLIGHYATLTWAPALLYIGADVYDKYKNDQTEYSPDSRRCLKQACFQGLASILLPIVAVKGGQNLFSLFGFISKNRLSISTKEQIVDLAQQFVANGKMRAHKDNDSACIQEFLDIVDNNINYKKQVNSTYNPFNKNFYNRFKLNKKEHINRYSEDIMKELITTRRLLLNPYDNFKQTTTYINYENALNSGQTKNVAVKSSLNKLLDNKSLKGKFIKTIGGFLALGLLIKPIDNFVENVLIGKVIGPGIDKAKRPAK